MAGQEAVKGVEAGSGPRKRVRAPTRAGYMQVIELMGYGYSAREVRKILRIPPNRLRQILASRSFLKMVQLEGQVAKGAAVLRVGGNVNEAIDMLKSVWDSSDPECVRKAAVKVLDIAMQPPPRLSDYRPSGENWKIAGLLRQMVASGPAGNEPAPAGARGGRNTWDTRREDGNA
jgi:hypothetical protein